MANLIICDNLQKKVRENAERETVFFLRQGDLDGACAIYSLMMLLIITGKVKYSDLIQSHSNEPGYTSLKRLQNELLANLPGLYKDGYYFTDVRDKLNSAFKKVAEVEVCTYDGSGSRYDQKCAIQSFIIGHLKQGQPVEIGYTRKGGKEGHAVLAVGIQNLGNGINRLFCLDPGVELGDMMYWNAIIDMETVGSRHLNTRATYCDWSINEQKEVDIDEVLYLPFEKE